MVQFIPFPHKIGIITKCCELSKLCDNFPGAWKQRPSFLWKYKIVCIKEENCEVLHWINTLIPWLQVCMPGL